MHLPFEKLTPKEYKLLLRAPVLVSVLAAASPNKINESQKTDAIELAHLKTSTANPVLLSYYAEVEKNFKEEFEAAAKKYFPFDQIKRAEIKKELEGIYLVIEKLDRGFGLLLSKSLKKYETHVRRAGRSIFEDFIFPVPLPGLTD